MFTQAARIYSLVNNEISGSGNIQKNDEPDESKRDFRAKNIAFCRDMAEAISTSCRINKQDFITSQAELSLFIYFTTAALTEIYKFGNCAEYSSLLLVRFLTEGITTSIDMIQISDNAAKKNHTFLLANRNAASNIQDPTTWGHVIRIDGWPLVGKVDEFRENSVSKVTLLNPVIHQIDDIQSLLRFDKNLSSSEWKKMSEYFDFAKSLINRRFVFNWLRENKLDLDDIRYVNLDAEVAAIKDKFETISAQYKLLSEQALKVANPKEEKLAMSTMPAATFSHTEKDHICNTLKNITGLEWIYSPAKDEHKAEARLISSDETTLEKIVAHFDKYNIKVEIESVSGSDTAQFVAHLQDVNAVKLEKVVKMENAALQFRQ